MNGNLHIQLTENKQARHPLDQMTAHSGVDQIALVEAFQRLITIKPSWERNTAVLEAGRSVGSMTVGRLRIDVLPRMSSQELGTLIRFVWHGELAYQRSAMPTSPIGLDELIAEIFADEAARIRQYEYPRQVAAFRRDGGGVVVGAPNSPVMGRFEPISCRIGWLGLARVVQLFIQSPVRRWVEVIWEMSE